MMTPLEELDDAERGVPVDVRQELMQCAIASQISYHWLCRLYKRADSKWKDAVIDAAIVDWVYVKEHDEDPKKAVNDLLCWQQKIALDPAVSNVAAAWRDKIERAKVALQKIIDEDDTCGCNHDSEDCCNLQGVSCSRCIAAEALKGL